MVKKNGGRGAAKGEGSARRVSASRRAASEILRRVEEDGSFAAVLLASAGEELRADDRALCYELVLGVLRRRLWLDKLIEHYAGRDAASLDAPVRRALQLGLYQLRFLTRVPASAAVNESVNLAHEARLRSAANFINAVLRRATREPDYEPSADAPTELERLAVATSHPAWLIERWVKFFGAAETESFAQANNRTPPVAFRVNPRRANVDEVIARLHAEGVGVQPSEVVAGAWRVNTTGGGAAQLRALNAEGAIYTQDEASQLVANVVGVLDGERVLDVCAAPVSKTTQIAAGAGESALVVAGDLHGHRLRVVRESAARQGLENIRLVAYDAEESPLPFAAGAFRRVLVDAPCTGTGTLRHNPEIRWRITPGDIVELAARQRRILSNAARAVGVGGQLVYSTCSVEPEENEEVVGAFLQTHPAFELIRPDVPERLLTKEG
ncbi:MAG TPA: 16S rRNA (cytosine(967)-C(5))-methyltransferase RsmB, partial [Pyrinomonadaceae bacterium]